MISGIKKLASRRNFLEACEHWRQRNIPNDVYADIYDGHVWKDLFVLDGSPFLANPGNLNLRLMLNIDWFNPFDETLYSVGANCTEFASV